MYKNALIFVSILTSAMCATLPAKPVDKSVKNAQPTADTGSDSWLGSELSVLQKVYDDCQDSNDFASCLKSKALIALSRAIEMDNIQILDGISLVKQNETLKENETIPGISDARTLSTLSGIDKQLVQRLDRFLRTHTLKLDMSDKALAEGRGKDGGLGGGKKNNSYRYVIAALMTAMGIAGPLGLKALAAIAGKALVISKVALTIAGIIALKKIFSSDHHEETSFQVHSGDHNRRNAYLVRHVKPAAGGASAAAVDPYRYYYDQQQYAGQINPNSNSGQNSFNTKYE